MAAAAVSFAPATLSHSKRMTHILTLLSLLASLASVFCADVEIAATVAPRARGGVVRLIAVDEQLSAGLKDVLDLCELARAAGARVSVAPRAVRRGAGG